MYIIVKQLSNASPTRNLQKQKAQKLWTPAVASPPANPIKLVPTNAGILP